LLQAASPILQRKHGYFDLLGCDFMVTDDNKLLLIEVNTNPALSLDNSTLEKLLPNVVDQTIDIVLSLQGPPPVRGHETAASAVETDDVIKFEMIFDEEKGFKFGVST
jgi:hypothetical protein